MNIYKVSRFLTSTLPSQPHIVTRKLLLVQPSRTFSSSPLVLRNSQRLHLSASFNNTIYSKSHNATSSFPTLITCTLSRRLNSTSAVTSGGADASTITSKATEVIASGSPDVMNTVLENGGATAIDTVMKIGDLKAMGLASNWTPVGWLQQVMEVVNVSIGLPWWATIISVTLLIRLATTPVYIKLLRNSVRMANIRPEIEKLTSEMKKAQGNGDMVQSQMAAFKMQELFKKHDVSIGKMLGLPLLQAPIFISFFLALRKMAEAGVPGMKDGGMGWFMDLTAADPTYVLPALGWASFVAVLELGGETGPQTGQAANMKMIFRVASVIFIPAMINFPAAVLMYWVVSNSYTLGQSFLLRQPDIRKRLNVPPLIQHPDVVTAMTGAPKQMGFWESFNTARKSVQNAQTRAAEDMKTINAGGPKNNMAGRK